MMAEIRGVSEKFLRVLMRGSYYAGANLHIGRDMTGMRLHFEIQPDWCILIFFAFASSSFLVMDDFTRYPFIALSFILVSGLQFYPLFI